MHRTSLKIVILLGGTLAACSAALTSDTHDGGADDLDAGLACICPREDLPDAGGVDAGHVVDAGADAGEVDAGPEMDAGEVDAGAACVCMCDVDAGSPSTDAGQPPADGGVVSCSVDGNPGQCMDATGCSALPAFSAVAGHCPGPAEIQCCVLTPNTANNPPVPSGWSLMTQANVTADMTTWAVEILNSPEAYPRFDSVVQQFGTQWVMARVEWHPPDFQNGVVHRGVTLYQP